MEETKNILFASDLSTEMETVFKHAATTAIYQKTHIIVVHVMEENSRAEKRVKTAFGEQLYQNLKSEHREGAHKILLGKNVDALRIQQAIAGFFQGGNNGENDDTTGLISKIIVTQGRSIADEITATAVEEGCNMIVMGCKQQNLLAKAMGDNLVRKVLKRSTVPVLMVPFKK